MEQYVKGFQRFHAGEDVRPVTSALASFYHLFQVYYKVRQVLLQSATAFFITKCDGLLLQSATSITKCDNFITKCDRYYKVRRLLESATIQTGYPFQRRFLELGIKIVDHGFIFCLKLLLIMKKHLFDV